VLTSVMTAYLIVGFRYNLFAITTDLRNEKGGRAPIDCDLCVSRDPLGSTNTT